MANFSKLDVLAIWMGQKMKSRGDTVTELCIMLHNLVKASKRLMQAQLSSVVNTI